MVGSGMYLCRACGAVFEGSRACPNCTSPDTYPAADCPVCGEGREAAAELCDRCAGAVEARFRSLLSPLHPAEVAYLDRLTDGRSFFEFL